MRERRGGKAPWRRGTWAVAAALAAGGLPAADAAAQTCAEWVADVAAIDQPVWYNRLGAHDPDAMLFALKDDVVYDQSSARWRLREGKRPRPLVLRVPEGDCLVINLWNHLRPQRRGDQPATRDVSIHVTGMQVRDHISQDGTSVGLSPGLSVAPGQGPVTYVLMGEKEGTYLLYSSTATTGGQGDGGQISKGLFGAVNVEPRGSEWYRSQVTAEDLRLATRMLEGDFSCIMEPCPGAGTYVEPHHTPGGHPVVDYDAVYPNAHPLAGRPILRMTHGNRIVHSDLTAIITGPNRGPFPAGQFPPVEVNRDRTRPFREVTVIFHDEPGLVQAFDSIYNDPRFEHTLHSGRDGFAINYGTGGMGSEVIANRSGVGPMADCIECKYEEFFLTSWVVGDPAMIVDVPADADLNGDGRPDPGRKATRAFFPDDPSNVYHSYMNDHVKIRNLHAGPKEHHIFHLHAHQWLHSPNSDSSTYLDSQAIGPGGGFTYEITYDGGGNRNKTPGDAIFHCHFYPHFAQGMWALWRVHDVFESGTILDDDGRPAAGARALPDGEILAGTPIPAVVPIPTYALAPMPTDSMPGFPFYIPGRAGHRPPRPPMDMVFDGGLRRHIVVDGTATFPALNTTDFSKHNPTLGVIELPENGTPEEVRAMAFHAQPNHPTYVVDPVTHHVQPALFRTNGAPPAMGAPFADPCVDDAGNRIGREVTYKAAAFQLDVIYNKAGWAYPQHRMFALWRDVMDFLGGRSPEPLFFRANTNDCITYHLVNLVPHEYQMDDFQVRTPTDIIGQHIHLVKFDVTASDGASNGFNYEDGSLSPGDVQERIHAIRAYNGCNAHDTRNNTIECPVLQVHPFFGPGPDPDSTGIGQWVGAQESVQRWFVDDVRDRTGRDRTLRTVFTHDHFGPSTHQQAGLYAGLVTEPEHSVWRNMETGQLLGGRDDGGPTSWKADILTQNASESYREFNLQLADFSLAYTAGKPRGQLGPSPREAINPPGRKDVGLPFLLAPPVDHGCPNGDPAPCPELVSADDPGTMLVNYRNEPLALRIGAGGNTQVSDLADAFSSRLKNAFTNLPHPYGPRPGVITQDPFTPLLWGYEGDRVQVRVLVGAHEEGHNFSIHGNLWNFEPADANSGWRGSQMMGISEHYEFLLPPLPKNNIGADMDYLYRAGSATDDLWNGVWGLLRVSQRGKGYAGLTQLPNNHGGDFIVRNQQNFNGICPKTAPLRTFDVTARLARDMLPQQTLTYNARQVHGGPLHDPTAIMYVRTSNLTSGGQLKAGVPVEPLVLRALPGDCIEVTLRNTLPTTMPDLDGFNMLPMIVDSFNNNQIRVSNRVGLHAQLVAYDVTRSDGVNVGLNPVQTVNPGHWKTYQWYAGTLFLQGDTVVATPVEFGAINLMPADPIKQASKGAIGALIIEPAGSSWSPDAGASAVIWRPYPCEPGQVCPDVTVESYEHVLFFQTDLNLRFGSNTTLGGRPYAAGSAVPNLFDLDDPEDSGQKGFNYRTEPMWFRMGFSPEDDPNDRIFTNVLLNSQVGGHDPQTPVFRSPAGSETWFRILLPGGHARNSVFNLHGHLWQELPFTRNSTALGFNPFSEWKGTLDGHGPTHHDNVLLRSAGGWRAIQGDYLFRDQASMHFSGGMWGIFRVGPGGIADDECTVDPESGLTVCTNMPIVQ